MNKTFLYSFVVVFTLICGLCFSAKADNVRISGKVVDSEDKPIEFATVRVANSAIGTNTDLKGNYSLSMAQKDTLEVIYSCIGFKAVHHKLIRPKGELT
ncbi:MAG: carboxypeptidase-like regulatory domain-containing protein, partial [Muribaculaceae bacterium]|nr:carboxypeptidase-like regulatory domain-containing protein [Muribaculaceae bacterium]